jgi:hypothetical protein
MNKEGRNLPDAVSPVYLNKSALMILVSILIV